MTKYKKSGSLSHLKIAVLLFLALFLPLAIYTVKNQTNTESEAAGSFRVDAYTFYDTNGDGIPKGDTCSKLGVLWSQDGQDHLQFTKYTAKCPYFMKFYKSKGCTTISIKQLAPDFYVTGYTYEFNSNFGKAYFGKGKSVTLCKGAVVAFGIRKIN